MTCQRTSISGVPCGRTRRPPGIPSAIKTTGACARDLTFEELDHRPCRDRIERVHRIPFVINRDAREVVRPLLFGRGEYRRT